MRVDKSKFDREERQIQEAFSRIKVNHRNLNARIKHRLHAPRRESAPRMKALLAAALVLVFISAATIAGLTGAFDRFIEGFHPGLDPLAAPYAEEREPAGLYAEDQGILITIIQAEHFGNTVLVHLSAQDISGENRLTEQSALLGVGFISPESEEDPPAMVLQVTHFDEANNIAYFEFPISALGGFLLPERLEFEVLHIFFRTDMYENVPVDTVSFEVLSVETIPFAEGYILTGWDDFAAPERILAPGNLAPMPHGNPRQWISNIGLVNGQLRVQYGGFTPRDGDPVGTYLSLLSPEGEVIYAVNAFAFLTNDDLSLINVHQEGWCCCDDPYMFVEFTFDADIDRLSDYRLLFSTLVTQGTAGDWRFAVDMGAAKQLQIVLPEPFYVDGLLFESIAFSERGLEARGRYEPTYITQDGVEIRVPKTPRTISAKFETADGLIPLCDFPLGTYMHETRAFILSWPIDTPVDPNTVTAILIDGKRIPVS